MIFRSVVRCRRVAVKKPNRSSGCKVVLLTIRRGVDGSWYDARGSKCVITIIQSSTPQTPTMPPHSRPFFSPHPSPSSAQSIQNPGFTTSSSDHNPELGRGHWCTVVALFPAQVRGKVKKSNASVSCVHFFSPFAAQSFFFTPRSKAA